MVSAMTVQDEQPPVIYGSPPPPFREEIQSTIGEELRARYTVPQELPYRLLIVLMQLKELDRNPPRPPMPVEQPQQRHKKAHRPAPVHAANAGD
jgi:hypothetical protein